MNFTLQSPNFKNNADMSSKYTCEGENISPELIWNDPPAGTKAFALIVDDPDAPDPKAPKKVHVHWVLYNIPSDVHELKEHLIDLPQGAINGTNDSNKLGYTGPCPPIGKHRYFFKLYALKEPVSSKEALTKKELEYAMKNQIIGEATLVGTYQKAK